MSLLGSLDESEGGLKDIYPFRYREDYRTVVKHTGKVPVTVRQLYTCYLEYKNTIKEFFWTLSASYSHNRYNLITERNYKDGNFYLSSVERNHSSHSYILNTIGSKGIYDWNLKTSLELTLARNEGKQLNEASFRITGMTICASNLKLCGLLLYFSRLNTKRRSVVWEAE